MAEHTLLSAPTLRRVPPSIHAGRDVHALAPALRLVLRAGPQAAAAIAPVFGVAAPTTACRAAVTADGQRAALWLGPDEWLLVAPEAAADLAVTLPQALAALPHALVDVSHRQTALAVQGAHAALLLSSGCPLDLEPAAFPVGMCTRTVLAKAEIVLWRTRPDSFRIEVWRSFAAYVSAWLDEAGRGLTA